jgi:hypothetical protein
LILCQPSGGRDQGEWVGRVVCSVVYSQACWWKMKVLCISWAICGDGIGGEEGRGGDGGGVDGPLLSNLFLWNQIWLHITDASRVKDWASCNWRLRCFPGLRINLTQSAMEVKGSRLRWIGHVESSQMDWAKGHWLNMWRVVSSWALHKRHVVSIDGIRAAKMALIGRISHAIFHRRSLWRGLILVFQRVF